MSESSSHGALLTIDLAALAENWRRLAARCAPATCAAVVKADAYGLGIEAAVPALWKAGCRRFYVAHLSEAERVRAVAPAARIGVLNGFPPGAGPAYAALGLLPVLGSPEEVEEWRAFAAAQAAPPAILHVDTGMNRLGLRVEEALALDPAGLNLAAVMSHFVASEEPDSPLNARQVAAFERIRQHFPNTALSLPNSSGFFLEHRQFYEEFRAGYALYGGNPTPGRDNPMRPVVRLAAPVIAVRSVLKGESVGYNAQWTARRDSRIAVISVGYADGYPRAASATDATAGGAGRVAGVIAPFAGRVSMDLIALDVTDAPAGSVVRGTEIALIDEVLTVDRVGAAAGTIGYEVLTSLGKRYRRRTLGD